MLLFLRSVLFLLRLRTLADASNILVWNPTLSHSHTSFLGNIADVLTAAGHNVTIFSPILDPNTKSFGNHLPARTIDFTSSKTSDDFIKPFKSTSLWEAPECTDVCVSWNDFDLMAQRNLDCCKEILEDAKLLDSLKDSKFELAYTETLDLCAPGIFEILDIKNVVLMSAALAVPRLYDVAGLRQLPSFVPVPITPYSDEMTFKQRIRNFITNMQFYHHTKKWDQSFNEMFGEKYPGFPTPHEIYVEKTALIMINVHEFFESPRPITNMIKYIGGFKLAQAKPLTKSSEIAGLRSPGSRDTSPEECVLARKSPQRLNQVMSFHRLRNKGVAC